MLIRHHQKYALSGRWGENTQSINAGSNSRASIDGYRYSAKPTEATTDAAADLTTVRDIPRATGCTSRTTGMSAATPASPLRTEKMQMLNFFGHISTPRVTTEFDPSKRILLA